MNWRDLDISDQTAKAQEKWELNQRLYRAWKSGLSLERVSEILEVSITAACAVLIFDAERSRHKPPILDYINFGKNREWQKCALFEKALKTLTIVNSD